MFLLPLPFPDLRKKHVPALVPGTRTPHRTRASANDARHTADFAARLRRAARKAFRMMGED